jgi:hypothetical protein
MRLTVRPATVGGRQFKGLTFRSRGGVALVANTGPSGIYGRLAARGYGPVVFTEDIEVRGATKDEATFLEIPIGEPVYEVLRTAIDVEDRKVETCTNVLAAKQWRLTYRWRQESAEIPPATP